MSSEIRQLLQDVAAGEIGPAIAGRAAAALSRHEVDTVSAALFRVTMTQIDSARADADAAIAARRAYQAEDRPRCASHRGETIRRYRVIEYEVAKTEERVLELLGRWWAQGCRP